MSLYEIGFNYNKEIEIIKTKIKDKENEIIIFFKIYTIKGQYYIDIYTNETIYELGRTITLNVDMLKHTKERYIDFPKVELKALATNKLGNELDFSFISASLGLHDLYIIAEE